MTVSFTPTDMTAAMWTALQGQKIAVEVDSLLGRSGLYEGTLVRTTWLGDILMDDVVRTRRDGTEHRSPHKRISLFEVRRITTERMT